MAASLGGRLRYVLVCDRDMDEEVPYLPYISLFLSYISATSPVHLAQVRQFFEVAVSAAVLPVFGFPEVGGSLYLPHISLHLPISPLCLPYTCAYLPVSPLYLPYISPTPPLHLACISQAGGLVAMLTPSDRAGRGDNQRTLREHGEGAHAG